MTVTSISDIGLPMTFEGLRNWLDYHSPDLLSWTQKNIDFSSWESFQENVWNSPELMGVMYHVIRQDNFRNSTKVDMLLNELHKHDGIYMILGKPGAGKTALMHFLGEKLYEEFKERLVWFGPPTKLPKHIQFNTLSMDKLPLNAVVLLDEASIQCFSRSRSEIIRDLATQRHSDRTWIFCSQMASLADVNITRLSKGVFFLSPTTFSHGTERQQMFTLGGDLKMLIPSVPGRCLYFDNDKLIRFNYYLPDWWSDEYSKPYRKFKTKADSYRAIFQLLDDGQDIEGIMKQLSIRETSIDERKLRVIISNYRKKGSALSSLPDSILTDYIDAGWDDTPINTLAERYMGNKKMVQGKPMHYNFSMKSTQADWFAKMRERNRDMDIACETPYNIDMIEEITETVHGNSNLIVSCQGWTGTGKSLSMLGVALMMRYLAGKETKPEDVKNMVFYSREALIARINELLRLPDKGRNEVLILDEAGMHDFGIGSDRPKIELNNILQTIRQRQIHFLFCSPKEHTSFDHFEAQMFGKDEGNGVARLLIKKDLLYYGYITVARPPKEYIDQYEMVKSPFLDAVQSRDTSERPYRKIAEELAEDELVMKAKTKSDLRAVLKELKPNLMATESEMIISWILMGRK